MAAETKRARRVLFAPSPRVKRKGRETLAFARTPLELGQASEPQQNRAEQHDRSRLRSPTSDDSYRAAGAADGFSRADAVRPATIFQTFEHLIRRRYATRARLEEEVVSRVSVHRINTGGEAVRSLEITAGGRGPKTASGRRHEFVVADA